MGRQRAHYLGGLSSPTGRWLIDINSHTPIDRQDRPGFFDLIETSKINLNITAGGSDCMRFWELFGAGGFVLSEKHSQVIEPPYLDGIHLDRFSSREEMLDKIAFYLKHEELREQIRKQGYDFTMNNHTCFHRMRYIIAKAKELGYNLD
jgi:spore maturation protein CgeB